MYPSVDPLQVHLPNMHQVRFEENCLISDVLEDPRNSRTMLTQFFKINETDPDARRFLYREFPEDYRWIKSRCEWQIRRSNQRVIGRLYVNSPLEGERFYMRLLLNHVRGPQSFEHLRTVNGVTQPTFRAAAESLGLIESDESIRQCLLEASFVRMPSSLRRLFATILVYCQPTGLRALWDEFFTYMVEDYPSSSTTTNNGVLTHKLLQDLDRLLRPLRKRISDFTELPSLFESTEDIDDLPAIMEEYFSVPVPEEDLTILHLRENMRTRDDSAFATRLLSIGNGDEPTVSDHMIKLPKHMVIPSTDDVSIEMLIDQDFSNLSQHVGEGKYMVERAIITPLNEDADKINDKVVEKFLGEGKTYYSIDSVPEDRRNLYQQEFLNSISASGLPPHALTLKPGVPLMLLRNIDPKNGLCNGTRLLCRGLKDHFIDAEILTGHSRGSRVFLPRIPLKSAEDIKLPFELTTCKVELKPWHFWSRKGYKSFEINIQHKLAEESYHQLDIYWDLRSAKFSGSSPEPCSDYYLALVSDEEVVLLLGDNKKKAYKRTKKRPALVDAIQSLKKEIVYAKKSFATRARFTEGKGEHDVVIESSTSGPKDPEMWISIDGIVLIHVKNLQWKFRGNEMVVVNKTPIQVLWDVHAWLFSNPGTGCGLFVFKPGAPEVEFDREGSNRSGNSDNSFGSMFYSTQTMKEKLYPNFWRRQKAIEFTDLKQGDMTIEQYYEKFVGLMKFDPELVPTEERKAIMFETGFSLEVKLGLGGLTFKTLEEVYDRAAHLGSYLNQAGVESSNYKRKENPNQNFQRNYKRFKPQHNFHRGGQSNVQRNGGQYQQQKGVNGSNKGKKGDERVCFCKRCPYNHPGKDYKGKLVECNYCHKLGHPEYECFSKNLELNTDKGKSENQFGQGNRNHSGGNNYQGGNNKTVSSGAGPEVIPAKSVTKEMQQQPAAIPERGSSNPPSAITTPILPIVHQWKMVTRKNRGKRVIVPCSDNNEGLLLDGNDEEHGIGEENTGEIIAGENPSLL
ncbi:hypothetical protein BVRB_9g208540 [Beta vulgaris subsp. vulgaris]|nr:hypothetical protein BVRB_9g208540 [Beta vulgaris subsp. vulgaris]